MPGITFGSGPLETLLPEAALRSGPLVRSGETTRTGCFEQQQSKRWGGLPARLPTCCVLLLFTESSRADTFTFACFPLLVCKSTPEKLEKHKAHECNIQQQQHPPCTEHWRWMQVSGEPTQTHRGQGQNCHLCQNGLNIVFVSYTALGPCRSGTEPVCSGQVLRG